jgi:hypothetical protein
LLDLVLRHEEIDTNTKHEDHPWSCSLDLFARS